MPRPTVTAGVEATDGRVHRERFLVDSGADRTVFSAGMLGRLGAVPTAAPAGQALAGVGGSLTFVELSTLLEFVCEDGGVARVRGTFAATADPSATDLSILGRDVLSNFDVIVSRRLNEVLLLGPGHRYRVEPG
jgi:hypothetical protein